MVPTIGASNDAPIPTTKDQWTTLFDGLVLVGLSLVSPGIRLLWGLQYRG